MYNTSRREKRAKTRLATLVQKMEDTELINAEQAIQLQRFENIPTELFSKPHNSYSESQKQFATTLHLYSKKAYEFVREKLHLPHSRTIQR